LKKERTMADLDQEHLEHVDTIRGEDLCRRLDEVARRAADESERFVVTHAGQRFALVPLEDLQWLERQDRLQDQDDLARIRELEAADPESMRGVPFRRTT
jgi:hypothetical protein